MASQVDLRSRRDAPSPPPDRPSANLTVRAPEIIVAPPVSPSARPSRWIHRRLLRLLVHDRARARSWSPIQFVSRRRTYANYRFAAGLAGGKYVLDVGAGHGLGTGILLGAGVAALVAVDPSPAILQVRVPIDPRLRLIQASVEQAGLPEASFDLVTCFAVAYFVHGLPSFLNCLAGLLRPGGRLLINTIDPAFLEQVFARRAFAGHAFAWWTLPGLRSMLADAGFRIEGEWQQTAIPANIGGAWRRWTCAAWAGLAGGMTPLPAQESRSAFYRLFSARRVTQP